ncbi:MAG: 6,7-dimethyl-8-ribityllumazine synthase [Gemmataceae bacterium]
MPTFIEGDFAPPVGRFAVVAARFNGTIVEDLVAGAIDGLRRHGVADADIDIVRVPGSFEVPLVAHRLALSKRYAAVVCLGAVIRGETTHYDHVCAAATSGIARAGLDSGVPVIFGILTTDTLEQAINRAGGKSGNKGFDAALAAVEMANLMRLI